MSLNRSIWGLMGLVSMSIICYALVAQCKEDNWGVEYGEITDWHEIGAPDPRYQDPCGPGVHEGHLGAPGCLQ